MPRLGHSSVPTEADFEKSKVMAMLDHIVSHGAAEDMDWMVKMMTSHEEGGNLDRGGCGRPKFCVGREKDCQRTWDHLPARLVPPVFIHTEDSYMFKHMLHRQQAICDKG